MEGPESILGGLSGSVWDTCVWMAKGGVASGKHLSPPFQPIKRASPVALLGECVCARWAGLGWAGRWGGTALPPSACVDSEVKNGACVF